MATAPVKAKAKPFAQPIGTSTGTKALMTILLPYALAILAQVPMLVLYFKQLWERPHYQSYPFALVVTAALVFTRWPYNNPMPFHRNGWSDFLLVLAVVGSVLSVMFVEPWFAAFSMLMIITSLLARTYDKESTRSLWACALPLFVFLLIPDYDSVIITRLQAYSAQFTSQLLDLIGLGHHMNGTVIIVPGQKQYGVEEACSGVVSFFTLLAITTAYIVWARRIATPSPAISVLLIATGLVMGVIDSALGGGLGFLAAAGIGLILIGCFGFRAGVLLASAVFWALFMNTLRILLIPVIDYQLDFDLSEGIAHDFLGYAILLLGVLMVLSTDQFLLFLFGPVDPSVEVAGPFGRGLTKFWNGFLAGSKKSDDDSSSRVVRQNRQPVGKIGRGIVWTVCAVVIICGAFQLLDVQRSYAMQNFDVRFFDTDVTMDFEKDDVPEMIGNDWKQVEYQSTDRKHGSDLGRRSDIWQFQAPRCRPLASLDQTFPGWHELTTCYLNQGWMLEDRNRITPDQSADGGDPWSFVEATFTKATGEKAYLLFSHFDSVGDPVPVPQKWGSLNSLMTRAQNRLSHRIRASLFAGEVYQTQVFLQSFREFDPELKDEIKRRYQKIREIMRTKFKEKRLAESEAS